MILLFFQYTYLNIFFIQTFFKYEGFGKQSHHLIYPNSKYSVTIQSLPMYVGKDNQINNFISFDIISPGKSV